MISSLVELESVSTRGDLRRHRRLDGGRFDRKIAARVAFVIDARGVGSIADNDQGTRIVLICDSIHASHPSKSWLVKAGS